MSRQVLDDQNRFTSLSEKSRTCISYRQADRGTEVVHSGNHACQLRARRRSMQFPYNQTANTGSLYAAAPSQRTLVIPYANSMPRSGTP